MEKQSIVPIDATEQVGHRTAGHRVYLLLGSAPPQFFVESGAIKATRNSHGPRRSPVPADCLLVLTAEGRSYTKGKYARRAGAVAEYVQQFLEQGPAKRGELEAILAAEMAAHPVEAHRYTAPATQARTDVSALIHVYGFLAPVPQAPPLPAVPLPPPIPRAPVVATMLPRPPKV